jgi:hypothetical protein
MDATMCSDSTSDPRNCGGCAGSGGVNCGLTEACVAGSCEGFIGNVGTVMKTDGSWIPVTYVLCGSGSTSGCTAAVAQSSCSGLGAKVVSHASDGTSTVYDLGATTSCNFSTSYFTVVNPMPSGSCLVGISNLMWTSCCTHTRWHGNTLDWGAPGAIFGYVYSSNSGYVSTYPNVNGTHWGCQDLTTSARAITGCTSMYVACTL